MCLDAATGKRVWHFQTVHHDLFDYDNPAAPILADITVDGAQDQGRRPGHQAGVCLRPRSRDRAAGVADRGAAGAAVDRARRERRRRRSRFRPSRRPSIGRASAIDDLIDFTPELRAEALEIVKKYVTGPVFTPPSIVGAGPEDTKGTIQLPGSVGGADWTGAAFDPETGMLYVPSMTNPFVANLLPGDPAAHQPSLSGVDARAAARAARAAADEAAVRPHHRDRSESRRAARGWSPTATVRAIIRCSSRSICRRSARRYAPRRS